MPAPTPTPTPTPTPDKALLGRRKRSGSEPPPVPRIEPGLYENRTRDLWVIDCPDREDGDIIFGDCEDRNREGRDPLLCPDPEQRLDAETIELISDHGKRFLASLLASKAIERKGPIA